MLDNDKLMEKIRFEIRYGKRCVVLGMEFIWVKVVFVVCWISWVIRGM